MSAEIQRLQLIETCRKRAAPQLHACDMFLSAAASVAESVTAESVANF